jgi:Flp pilus assembly protein TadD
VVGRGVFVAVAFFVVTLGPVLGLLMLYTFRYSFVADHYQYLACIGPIALGCAGAVKLAERFPRLRLAAGAVGGFVLIMLGALTWSQAHIYLNDESIWRDTLSKNPGSLMAEFNLANELMRDGSYQKSLLHYDRAVEIDPTFIDAQCNRADLLAHLGKLAAAAADYAQALKIEPNDAAVHLGCAKVLLAEGDFTGALPHYQQVARLVPAAAQPHMMLGHCYASLCDYSDAINEYREAVRLAPQSPEALTRLAWLLAQCNGLQSQNAAEAVTLAQRACDLTAHKSGFPLITLAASYAAIGRVSDALSTSLLAIDAASNAGDTAAAADFQKQMVFYAKECGLARFARQ